MLTRSGGNSNQVENTGMLHSMDTIQREGGHIPEGADTGMT